MISIPFRGSKKYSYKQVKDIVKENDYTKTFEPFGGTGVLSANLYNDGLIQEATINDYDRMFDIYSEYLDVKDSIVKECEEKGLRKIFCGSKPKHKDYYYDDNHQKVEVNTALLNERDKKILQEVVSQYDSKYYNLLSNGGCFTHSGSQNRNVELKDFIYFRGLLSTTKHRQYLKVIKKCHITHLDYKEFLNTLEFDSNSLLLVDPPYIDANIGVYKNEDIFDYETTDELVKLLKNLNVDFIFFNYDDQQIFDIFEKNDLEPVLVEFTNISNRKQDRRTQDILIYVKNSDTH